MSEKINKRETWIYEKFKGDLAIYAFCPKCNFYYNPSRLNTQTMKSELVIEYNYCPMCGEFLHDGSDSVDVVWNERDIAELYK